MNRYISLLNKNNIRKTYPPPPRSTAVVSAETDPYIKYQYEHNHN